MQFLLQVAMEQDIKRILLLFLISHRFYIGSAESDGLTTITNCICPGYNVVYQCVVTEGIFTVWRGNAFQCAGDSITLRNSEFGSVSSPAVGECNSRQILARGISQDNNCYISQLNVTLTEDLLGRTVTCGFNDGTLNLVSSTVITASTRPLMAPSNVLMDVAPSKIIFRWEHVSSNCPGLYYNVTSINCGMCSPGTETSQINCTDFLIPENGMNCTLSIQTVICSGTDFAVGGTTSSVTLLLKKPDAPNLKVVPLYREGQLIGTNISFSTNRFSLSNSIDGSPTSFTIMYDDTVSRRCAPPTTILTNSTSCVDERCTHYFSDICSSSKTIVTAFGSNVLGNGITSSKEINSLNFDFVVIDVILTPNSKQVICTFQGSGATLSGQKMCKIVITNGTNCQSSVKGTNSNTASSGDSVSINIDDLITAADEGKRFCYNVTAIAGSEEVVLQNTIQIVTMEIRGRSGSDTAAGVSVSIIVILVMALAAAIVVLIVVYVVGKPKNVSEECESRKVQNDGTNLEDFEKVIPGYNHLSQNGYIQARPNDRLSLHKGVIVRNEATEQKEYKAGYIIQKVFVNKRGYIRSNSERWPNFRGPNWTVFVPSIAANITLREGDEFLYCKAPIGNYEHNLEDDDSNIDTHESVRKLREWYYLYDIVLTDHDKCLPMSPMHMPSYGELLKVGVDERKIYHEEFKDINVEDGMQAQIAAEEIPDDIKVMAKREDGKWFEDTNRVLLRQSEYDPDTSIFKPPEGWKQLFFQSQGFRLLADGDKILFYDSSLALVPPRTWRVATVTDEESLTDVISVKFNKRKPERELKAGHIYLEKKQDEIEANDIFMALDKENKLCAGSGRGVNRLLQCEDYDKVWKFIFVQVIADDSELKKGDQVLYCKYK